MLQLVGDFSAQALAWKDTEKTRAEPKDFNDSCTVFGCSFQKLT